MEYRGRIEWVRMSHSRSCISFACPSRPDPQLGLGISCGIDFTCSWVRFAGLELRTSLKVDSTLGAHSLRKLDRKPLKCHVTPSASRHKSQVLSPLSPLSSPYSDSISHSRHLSVFMALLILLFNISTTSPSQTCLKHPPPPPYKSSTPSLFLLQH
jgi:hypothetical protein